MTVLVSGKDCLATPEGWDYDGMWDKTVSGRTCQRWRLNTVCPCVHVKGKLHDLETPYIVTCVIVVL